MKSYILLILFVLTFVCEVFSENNNDKPSRRFEEFNKERAYPYALIPENARENAFRQLNNTLHEKNSRALMLAQQPEWKNIGPFDIGGRIKSVIIHPENDKIVYIGAAAGGVWKTTNAGDYWEPVFDYENAISFGSLCFEPDNYDVIYAATGEAVNNSTTYLGSGLYRSEDAGENWSLIGLSEVGAFSKVYVHPKNTNLIYAGATKRSSGLWRSIDRGKTWERMFTRPVTDVTINPDNEDELLIGVDGGGIYYTKDGGINWSARNTNIDPGIGRVSIQMSPSEPNIAYALVETNGLGYIYKTTNTGAYWGRVFAGDATFFRNQGFYNNYIVVHPSNSNVVLAGGIDIWRTVNGATFVNMTNGYTGNAKMHVDQHCAAFYPPNPNIIYAGNDGGMYLSSDLGSIWKKINYNLQVTQFYSMDIDHTQPNRNVGGTQDNGTQGNSNTDNWDIIVGGDGFRVAVDHANPSIFYGSSTPGGQITPFRLNTQTNQFQYLGNGLNLNDGIWDPPIEIHPLLSDIILHGRKNLYVSFSSGNSWDKMNTGVVAQSRYSAIGMSMANEEVIYAGTSEGDVVVTTDFGGNWKHVTDNGLINRWVKDIACSNEDEATAYIVYSGFGTPHVFKTTDFGESWNAISDGLPDIPVNSIVIHPEDENIIFIGTDIGVFATFDNGKSWLPYGQKMARSPVTDVKISKYSIGGFYTLRAATHGRSIWEVQITKEAISTPEINRPIGGEIYTATTSQKINWYGFKEPVTVEFSTDNGSYWNVLGTNIVGGALSWNVPTRPSINARIRVISEVDAGQVRTSNTFTIMQIQKGSVLIEGGVNFVPYGIAWNGTDGLWSTSFYGNKITKLNLTTFLKEKEFIIEGDSLFTDIAMDREKGILYVHKIGSTTQGGGSIYVYDTTGKKLNMFDSPASKYPTGIEFVDGKLIVGDRDLKDEWDNKEFFVVNPANGNVEEEFVNACQLTYGPRCLAYDQGDYIYQVCTNFPNGGSLTEAFIQKLPKGNPTNETDVINLESLEGLINARGIDFDTRDENIWVTSFTGDIYKIAGFNTIVGVDEESEKAFESNQFIETKVYPNPAYDFAAVSFKMTERSGNMKINVFDLTGRKIAAVYDKFHNSGEAGFLNIDVSNLNSGMYNLVFTLDGINILTRHIAVVR